MVQVSHALFLELRSLCGGVFASSFTIAGLSLKGLHAQETLLIVWSHVRCPRQ